MIFEILGTIGIAYVVAGLYVEHDKAKERKKEEQVEFERDNVVRIIPGD